jgi:uncharacterized protein GlcG (DUF336 family)
MTKLPILVLAAAALAGTASAQTPPYSGLNPPPAGPRAKGPPLTPAVEAAQAAVAACLANKYVVTALIVDSAGVPLVMLSGDGAAERTQYIAASKAAAVMKYKMTSGDVAAKAKADPAFDAELKADPKIGAGRQGGVPIMAGGQLIGAFAVSDAPGGDKDEACVRAAMAKVGDRLK